MSLNNSKRINKKPDGFTLIDLIMVVMIIGLLASIAIPSYRDYILKAKAVEVTVFLADMRKKFHEKYDDDFPMEINGSKSRKLSQIKKTRPRVKVREMILNSPINTIDQYWYDADSRKGRNRNYAMFVVRLNKDVFPECGNGRYCTIHHVIKRSNTTGELIEFCGRWNKNRKWGSLPLRVLPEHCRTECVRCEMRKVN